jgi:hypothetical protein
MAQNNKSTRNQTQNFHILPWTHGDLEKALERLGTIIDSNPEDANCLLKVDPDTNQVVVNIKGQENDQEIELNEVLSTFSGYYKDLIDKPTIPEKVSQLINDMNFINKLDIQDEHNAIIADCELKYALKSDLANIETEVNNLKANNVSKEEINNLKIELKDEMPKVLADLQDHETVALKDDVQAALNNKSNIDHTHNEYDSLITNFNTKVQDVIKGENWSDHTHANIDALDSIDDAKIELINNALQPGDKEELQNQIDELVANDQAIVGDINELNDKVVANEGAIQDIVNATKELLTFEIEQHEHSIISEDDANKMIRELLDILKTN